MLNKKEEVLKVVPLKPAPPTVREKVESWLTRGAADGAEEFVLIFKTRTQSKDGEAVGVSIISDANMIDVLGMLEMGKLSYTDEFIDEAD